MIPVTTSRKTTSRLRKPLANVKQITLVGDEPSSPTSSDTLSHAIALYSTLRDQWRKGSTSENGICYVKVRGELVEVKITRPRY